MRGHSIAHTGQYNCQQCRAVFKTLGALDEHIRVVHKAEKHVEYKCEQCDAICSAQFHLRQHISKKHSPGPNESQTKFDCNSCGQIFQTNDELKKHGETCDVGFQTPGKSKSCYYFQIGECFKAESCKFKHQYRTS